MKKFIFPLIVAGAMFLAACGGDKKPEATAPAADTTAMTTEEPASTDATAEQPAEEAAPAPEASEHHSSSHKSSGSKASSSKEETAAPAAEPAPTKKIVGMAKEMGRFSQLEKAVIATGHSEILSKDGPFILFAPNDEAFAKIPGGTFNDYLKPENKDKLTRIIALHVAKGNSTIEELAAGGGIKTMNGKNLVVKKTGSKYMIGKAQVVNANIKCINGIIHEIDVVLLPSDF